MAKQKYKFNPQTLKYVKVRESGKQKFYKGLGILLASVFLAAIYYTIFSSLVDLPKEKGLRRQVQDLRVNYDLLQQKLALIDSSLSDLQERDDNIYRTIFEAEPIHSSMRERGTGGAEKFVNIPNSENSELIKKTAEQVERLLKKSYVQSKSYDEIIKLAKSKEKVLASIPAIQPISNKDLKKTASGWGYRIHPIYRIKKFHYGMDFTARTGTEIFATGDGVIEQITNRKTGYGKKIVLNHGFGYKTLYAHLHNFNVKVGQKVKRGDVIGFVGNTGTSTGPHLHYEVHVNNKKVNPVNYYFNDLTPEEYEKMIEISINSGKTFD